MTTIERNLEASLAQAQGSQWLAGFMRGVLDSEVMDEDALEQVLKRAYLKVRGRKDQAAQDAADMILDGLDLLRGWCGPGLKIAERRSA